MPDRYPAIADHAVIGDLHTVALVATDGTIDWCCLPRFDSPAVFTSLLDADRGGSFSVRCEEAARTRQLYMPDSNVLVTSFLGTGSVGEVVDFMVPRHPPAGLLDSGITGERRLDVGADGLLGVGHGLPGQSRVVAADEVSEAAAELVVGEEVGAALGVEGSPESALSLVLP